MRAVLAGILNWPNCRPATSLSFKKLDTERFRTYPRLINPFQVTTSAICPSPLPTANALKENLEGFWIRVYIFFVGIGRLQRFQEGVYHLVKSFGSRVSDLEVNALGWGGDWGRVQDSRFRVQGLGFGF